MDRFRISPRIGDSAEILEAPYNVRGNRLGRAIET